MLNRLLRITLNRSVLSWMALRLIILMAAGLALSYPLHRDTFTTYYNHEIIKLHTLNLKDLGKILASRFAYLLEVEDLITLQKEMNDNFGMMGFVITDCSQKDAPCPDEKMIFTSGKTLPWKNFPTVSDLRKAPYAILYGATPLAPDRFTRGRFVQEVDDQGNLVGRQVLGRLYLINNLPSSFADDFANWLKRPFADVGPHRIYLKTVSVALTGAFLTWIFIELFMAGRRLQLSVARQRADELHAAADNYLKQLEDKNQLIMDQIDYSMEQFTAYTERIRALELKLQDDAELREVAELLVQEIEQAGLTESRRYAEELDAVRRESEQLQHKLADYEKATARQKEQMEKEMALAFRPMFTNPFEQKVYDALQESHQAQAGEWLVIPNFNVGVGKNFSQFTDCLVVTEEAVIVVEAKNYPGAIVTDGDMENSKWYYHNPKRREIRCIWGLNPYHQINQYCMSVLTLINTRSRWKLGVYGILVFPNQSDTTPLGSLGNFYAAVPLGRLVETIQTFQAAARKNRPSVRRPTITQIEDMLRGRKND